MNEYIHKSYLCVDLDAAAENYRSLCRCFLPKTEVIPVLKGDAFGLGMMPVAKRLVAEREPIYLAVADTAEGVALREGEIACPVLLLAGVLPAQCPAVVRFDLTPGVGRLGLVPLLAEEARRQAKTVSVHIALDTGLGRLGVRPGEELSALLEEIRQNSDVVRVKGTYSHFGQAETIGSPKVSVQYARYCDALGQVRDAGIDPGLRHMSNSAASEWFHDADFDAVRLGRRMFFDSPTEPNKTVREVASWRTFITNLRHFEKGDTFGYGAGYTLDHDAMIALIGVGYGDGLDRGYVRAHAPVLLHGQRAPLVGMCMDQAYVDVTGIDCSVGDEVTMFGWDSEGNYLSAQETAAYIDDEGCGLTTMLLPRVPRRYE
jgi:alanine racemase